jgi:thioredoxin reductase (NADPH)
MVNGSVRANKRTVEAREAGVEETVDIAIVGGGPAGMTAALYGARARAKTVVFESGMPGGQIVSASWVENYPGFPEGISGSDLADLMLKQAEEAGAEIRTLSPVQAIRQKGSDFVLTAADKEVDARTVILATGAIPRRLGIPGEAEFTGRGISWCATCDGPLYRDKVVAVVGGGDSATQESLYLAKIASEVHLIHRRGELRATQCLQEECFLEPGITMHLSQVAEEILGEGGKVSGLRLRSTDDGSEEVLTVDGVFEFVGIDAQSELVAGLCDLDKQGFVKVDRNGLTSRAGVYAAGDVTDYELKQVVTACARGAFAVYDALHYLDSRDRGT